MTARRVPRESPRKMEYLYDYLLFGAKLVTVIALLAAPVVLVLVLRQSRRGNEDGEIEVVRLNDRLRDAELRLAAAMLEPRAFRKRLKSARAAAKARPAPDQPRTWVCEFHGDIRAGAVAQLREEITAILTVAGDHDEVIVVLESGGGSIHGYGLAASQLKRVRERGIRLRAVVDRIAASGGYMMACVADEIVAAPFAIVGSIGVVAQLPNFNRLLKKHDVDFEQITAGRYKRTLSLFGENTDEGRAKFREEIEDAHALFKDFVAGCRPHLDLERVGTGEYWFGTRALELGLVDRLATSDDVIAEAAGRGDVYRVRARARQSLIERILRPGGREAEGLLF